MFLGLFKSKSEFLQDHSSRHMFFVPSEQFTEPQPKIMQDISP